VDFIDSLMVKIALIGLLGIGAQWIAWRTAKPAIALMMIAGLIAGPVTGVIVPERDFGPLMEPIIKLAVAVILFDGGLSLNFRELRHSGGAVLGLVLIGVPVGWALGTAAAYYGAGLPLPISALFGGIMVVTGPTVIGPLLRNLNIGRRPAQILKWEGIVNDPIGALLAVFIFAWITYQGESVSFADIGLEVAGATAIAALLGTMLALLVTWLFPRGLVPEYLKAPALLVIVIAGFVLADIIYHETGLVTVTVMGLVIANRPIYSFGSLRRFKEDLGVLLVSGVFILLPATLDWATMRAFEARFLVFLLLLLFVVRPVTVMLSLLVSRVPWRERLFIAWIAPRGVVAVAITGLFAFRLEEIGIAGAEALVPLSFGVVIATIVAHGFSAPWLARRLGLDKGPGRGLLLVGANGWTIALGAFLKELGTAVTLADRSRLALRPAARQGLETYRGDILDEVTQDHLDLSAYQQLIAATDNPAHNALVCTDLGPEIGFHRVAQIGVDRERPPLHRRGRVLLGDDGSIDELLGRQEAGWQFRSTPITDRFGLADKKATMPEGTMLVAVLKPGGRLLFFSSESRPGAEDGDQLISYGPPER
jgi:NhaP-type Na+/H+ or K+/H+ antiporter